MTDLTVVDNAGRAGEAALDTIVGGAALALDAVSRPRRAANRARRRGSSVNASVVDTAEELVEEVVSLPEQALIEYLRLLRRTSRREDVVGAVTRAMLDAVNGPAREAARFFERVERETSTGTGRRGGRRTARATASRAKSARRTATAARRTAGTGRGRRSA
jgi:hypothetical protein